jgi:hypothetical protein
MVTLLNPADEAQDFVFTLLFKGGHYAYPVHLEARASRTFNVSEIIQNQIPDVDGNIIPPTVHEGSAKLSGSHADNEDILVAMDAGTYNVQKATCGVYCQTCDGSVNAFVIDTPFVLAVGGHKQESLISQWGSGGQYDYTSGATWSSTKTSVATVSHGLVTGVTPGTLTANAYYTNVPVYTPNACLVPPWSCPLSYQQVGGSSGGTVPLSVSHVVPSPLVRGSSGQMQIDGTGFQSFPGSPSVTFDGTGIVVNGPTASSGTLITATYSVASNTPLGPQNLTVAFSQTEGAQSAPFPVTVAATQPVPASAMIDSNVKQTYSKQTWTSCDGTQSQANAYGYQRCLIYQVKDQNSNDIQQNLVVNETVSVVDPGNVTSNLHTGNSSTNPAGQFEDGLVLIGTSTIASNACEILKQSFTATGNASPIRVNCLKFGSSDVTITDVTSNPNSCSKPTYHC